MASNTDYSGFTGEKISGLIVNEQEKIERSRTMNALDLATSAKKSPASTVATPQAGLVAGDSRGASK